MIESYWILLYGYIAYYLIVTIGITYGYHRYFSHQEFATNSVGEVVMLYCGLLCGCRSPLGWVGVHRMHHAFADTPKDPHSAKYQPWYSILFSLWRVDNIPRKLRITRTIKHKVGRDKEKNTVGILLKDRKTIKNINKETTKLKNKNIEEIKEYLRDKNIIKSGSLAPNDVLRKLYEVSVLSGNINNINSTNLLYNYNIS